MSSIWTRVERLERIVRLLADHEDQLRQGVDDMVSWSDQINSELGDLETQDKSEHGVVSSLRDHVSTLDSTVAQLQAQLASGQPVDGSAILSRISAVVADMKVAVSDGTSPTTPPAPAPGTPGVVTNPTAVPVPGSNLSASAGAPAVDVPPTPTPDPNAVPSAITPPQGTPTNPVVVPTDGTPVAGTVSPNGGTPA